MITEPATVVTVSPEAIWVRCEAQQACARCAEGRGCGGGILGRLLGDRLRLVRAAPAGEDLKAGDAVVIGLAESALVRASLVMYFVPLVAMLAAAVALRQLGVNGDPGAIAGGGAGLLAGLLYARRFGRRHGSDLRYQPFVVGRVASGAAAGCVAAALRER